MEKSSSLLLQRAEWWEPGKLFLANPPVKLQLGEQDNEVYFLVGTGASYHPEMILQHKSELLPNKKKLTFWDQLNTG